jgi:hypothetical protein
MHTCAKLKISKRKKKLVFRLHSRTKDAAHIADARCKSVPNNGHGKLTKCFRGRSWLLAGAARYGSVLHRCELAEQNSGKYEIAGSSQSKKGREKPGTKISA